MFVVEIPFFGCWINVPRDPFSDLFLRWLQIDLSYILCEIAQSNRFFLNLCSVPGACV
jgi:hypothetical protein